MANYQASISGADIDKAVRFVHTKIAPSFDNTSTYVVGDFVVYQGLLYQCITAILQAEEWDATKWQVQKIFDNNGYVLFDAGGAETSSNLNSQSFLNN